MEIVFLEVVQRPFRADGVVVVDFLNTFLTINHEGIKPSDDLMRERRVESSGFRVARRRSSTLCLLLCACDGKEEKDGCSPERFFFLGRDIPPEREEENKRKALKQG